MKTLAKNFNKVFPKFKMTDVAGTASVIEQSNEDNGKFRELEFTDVHGVSFCKDFASKITSIAKSGGNDGLLLKNCDGIHVFEYNGEKFLMLSELKSKYSTQDIVKAKDQLIGTYLNLIAVLSVMQGFNINEYRIFGLIASYKPTEETKSAISKFEDLQSAFAIRLYSECRYFMPEKRCKKFYNPLNVGDFTIVYIPVENHVDKYTVSIAEVIERVVQ